MDIDIKVIYKTAILNRIENGLEFIETYEKMYESIARVGPPPIRENKLIQMFQNCYKVTRNDVYKEDPDYVL